MGGHSKAMRAFFHSAVKVLSVAFVCVCEKRKLGDTGDITIYIVHILLPHPTCCGVVEYACLKTA